MHTVFKIHRGFVTNTSTYNLAEELDLKRPTKFPCYKNNVYCQNLNENTKRYLICSTCALNLLYQLRACMPIYKMYAFHFNLSAYVH